MATKKISAQLIANRKAQGWSDERARNTPKRKPNKLTYNGLTLTNLQWSRKTGISVDVINMRVRYGWSADRVLSTPKRITVK